MGCSGHLGTVMRDYDQKRVLYNMVMQSRNIESGDIVVFCDFETGLRTAGPVTIESVDVFLSKILLSSKVTVSAGDLMLLNGVHCETKPFEVKYSKVKENN